MYSDSGKDKMTIVLSAEILELLREYAYVNGIRSRNTAASEIISDFIEGWVEAGKPA